MHLAKSMHGFLSEYAFINSCFSTKIYQTPYTVFISECALLSSYFGRQLCQTTFETPYIVLYQNIRISAYTSVPRLTKEPHKFFKLLYLRICRAQQPFQYQVLSKHLTSSLHCFISEYAVLSSYFSTNTCQNTLQSSYTVLYWNTQSSAAMLVPRFANAPCKIHTLFHIRICL